MLSRPLPWFSCVFAWFALLFFLSSRPMPHLPGPEIPHLDKIIHTLYFAAGSTCFFVGFRLWKPGNSAVPALIIAVLFCAVIGISDEFHQGFVPGRSGNDPFDWLADVLGGFVGSGIGALVHGRVRAKALVPSPISR